MELRVGRQPRPVPFTMLAEVGSPGTAASTAPPRTGRGAMTKISVDPERSTIIVVGSWNQAIFNEDFVGTCVLTGQEKITTEIAMTPTGWIPRFTRGPIQLLVHPERVVWIPLDANEASLRRLEDSVVKLLSQLSVTPIRAVGINFGFETDRPTERLKAEVALEDLYSFKALGLEPRSAAAKLSFDIEDRTLNVTVEASTGAPRMLIELNFHKEVRDANEAIAAVRGKTEWARERALVLLKEAWDLEL